MWINFVRGRQLICTIPVAPIKDGPSRGREGGDVVDTIGVSGCLGYESLTKVAKTRFYYKNLPQFQKATYMDANKICLSLLQHHQAHHQAHHLQHSTHQTYTYSNKPHLPMPLSQPVHPLQHQDFPLHPYPSTQYQRTPNTPQHHHPPLPSFPNHHSYPPNSQLTLKPHPPLFSLSPSPPIPQFPNPNPNPNPNLTTPTHNLTTHPQTSPSTHPQHTLKSPSNLTPPPYLLTYLHTSQ